MKPEPLSGLTQEAVSEIVRERLAALTELGLLRQAVRALVSVNDSRDGAIGDVESIAGNAAAIALIRALDEEVT